jgi:uncharacterized cupredoxin-like copper-binding protein
MRPTRRGPGFLGSLIFLLAACASPGTTTTSQPSGPASAEPPASQVVSQPPSSIAPAGDMYVANATDFVAAADWDAAQTVRIELDEMSFTPNDISLEAGKPYVLEIVSVGDETHEFVAEDFMRTVAARKAETSESEVKVPFFTEIEVFAGKTAELFLIPLIPGTYELLCEIEDHREQGMEGTITVTGHAPATPALQLADIATGPWVANGADVVAAADWDTSQEITIDLAEMSFTPKDTPLTAGQPYVIRVVNVGQEKHEFVADEFFASIAFRKAEDATGEYKGPTLLEVEVFAGQTIELFLIPTLPGSYDLVCEIEGHFEKGMFGTLTVAPGS